MNTEFEAFVQAVGSQMEAALTGQDSIDLASWPLADTENDSAMAPVQSPVDLLLPVKVELVSSHQTLQARCRVRGSYVADEEMPYYELVFIMADLPEAVGWGQLNLVYPEQYQKTLLWILSPQAEACEAIIPLEPDSPIEALQLHCTIKDPAIFERLQTVLHEEVVQALTQPEKVSRWLAWAGLTGLRDASPVTRQLAAAGTPLPARELKVTSLLPDYQLMGELGEGPETERATGIALREGQLSLRINKLPKGARATYLRFEQNTWQRLQIPDAGRERFLFSLIGVTTPDLTLAAYAETFEFERGPVAEKTSQIAPLRLEDKLDWHQADAFFILIWAPQEVDHV